MRTFYVTTGAGEVTPGMKVVHRFPPLKVFATYCCGPNRLLAIKDNVIVQVEAESRTQAKKQVPGGTRVRSEVPEGGWESLERGNVRSVQMC